MDDATTRDRILHATLEVLEQEGIAALTVRRIAGRAGVNVAAANYHFGSKERLLEAVLEQTLRHGLWESLEELRGAVAAAQADGDAGTEAAVRTYLREFIGNMLRYPRLTEAHFHEALTRQDYGGVAPAEFDRFVAAMFEVVRPALRPGTEGEQRTTFAQFWYAALGTTLLPRLMAGFLAEGDAGADPLPPGYVDQLLDRLLLPHV